MHRLDRQDRRLIWRRAVWVASLMAVVAGAPVARWLDAVALTERVDAVAARITNDVAAETSQASWGSTCAALDAVAAASLNPPLVTSPALASWQTVGGCGAGASTGTGGGVKWIGRHVKGGLLNLECQASYIDTPYGYNFIGNTMMSGALSDRWGLAVSIPYLYKYMNDPYAVGIDLANKGPGDASVSVTHAFGDTRNWLVSLAAGIPTGVFDRKFRTEMLPQDRQLGLGTPSAQLVLDHVSDELWGVAVVGTSLSWRGTENQYGSSRAPAASVYGHVAYLIGAFAPSLGLTVTSFAGYDKDRLQEQAMPLAVVSPSMSLEWSADSIAVLASLSTPYEYNVRNSMVRTGSRMGNWMFTLGTAFILY